MGIVRPREQRSKEAQLSPLSLILKINKERKKRKEKEKQTDPFCFHQLTRDWPRDTRAKSRKSYLGVHANREQKAQTTFLSTTRQTQWKKSAEGKAKNKSKVFRHQIEKKTSFKLNAFSRHYRDFNCSFVGVNDTSAKSNEEVGNRIEKPITKGDPSVRKESPSLEQDIRLSS